MASRAEDHSLAAPQDNAPETPVPGPRPIGEHLSETVDEVRYPALVAAIQREMGGVLATAYHVVRDFLEDHETSH